MTCYNFNLNLEKYPLLQKLKKNELNQMIETIFKTGYDTIFPTSVSSDPLVGKITSLESTLERLIGIGSSKKGELAEIILESHINSRYGDISYMDMSQVNHSGDAHIKFDGLDTTIMLESKNYTTKVNKDEIDKMKSDMIHCNIRWGIFISWNSNIIGKKEFDLEIFHEKGIQYHTIYISNLSSDIDRLDLGIQLIRKLIQYTDNKLLDKNITWIYSMIQNDIEQLNSIVSKNYQLRLWFEEMETGMNQQMSRYYTKMRDYMYEMDSQIKEIINRITNTTTQSIETNNSLYNLYLEKFKDNKKLFPIISKLLDIMKEHHVIICDDNMIHSDNNIGSIKVMAKKINVYWNKYKHTSELGIDNNVESFEMIKVFLSQVDKKEYETS
jgi:hypothetical protein